MSILPPPSEPHYSDSTITLHHGDCLDILRELPDASVDAVCTDPPYGLEFMGKEWDGADGFRRSLNPNDAGRESVFGRTSRTSPEYRTSGATAGMSKPGIGERETGWPSHLGGLNPKCRNCDKWQRGANPCRCESPDFPNERLPRLHTFQEWCEAWAAECLRVLKPGGHMLAFGGTRTWHRLACAVEDAGFEVRDSIAWMYGSGFPKSMDVSKAIDKAAGAEREVVGRAVGAGNGSVVGLGSGRSMASEYDATAPATDAARTWQGWGSAMKPAFEPVVVARKPFRGTLAANVLTYGTDALNIDACRINASGQSLEPSTSQGGGRSSRGDNTTCTCPELADDRTSRTTSTTPHVQREATRAGEASADRRYTERGGTNFAPLPGVRGGSPAGRWPANVVLDESQAAALDQMSGESASPSKPVAQGKRRDGSGWDRPCNDAHDGEGVGYGDTGGASRYFYVAKADASERVRVNGTAHPTVKPLALMRWLVRLVTPPGGTVLEPFAGSGTTVEACLLEGFRCIAIEREADYLPLIMQRIHRRRDPVQAVKATGDDGGLFDLLGEAGA